MEKPRVKYSEQAFASQREGTVAWIIERYILAMDKTDRPVGTSGRYTLRNVAKAELGHKMARTLETDDIHAHCEARRSKGIKPSTVDKDISCLKVALDYAGAAWKDCKGISGDKIKQSKRFLSQHGLIGKSQPRDRIPTPEEIEVLCAYFDRPNPWNRDRIPMAWLTRWQNNSLRRVGETCRLEWLNWHCNEQTILVTKMKDPRRRDKAKVVALTDEAQAMLYELAYEMDERPELRTNEPRIFPHRAESCIAAYVAAKKATGIDGLHLHDSRRAGCTRLVQKGYSSAEAICYSGHETPAVFERTYLRMDAAKVVRDGPVKLRQAA